MGKTTYQLVQDFSHQQYHTGLIFCIFFVVGLGAISAEANIEEIQGGLFACQGLDLCCVFVLLKGDFLKERMGWILMAMKNHHVWYKVGPTSYNGVITPINGLTYKIYK